MKSNFILIYRNNRKSHFLKHDKQVLDSFKVMVFNQKGKGKIASEVLEHQIEHYKML